jgi:hypothetical protein
MGTNYYLHLGVVVARGVIVAPKFIVATHLGPDLKGWVTDEYGRREEYWAWYKRVTENCMVDYTRIGENFS